MVDVAEVYIWSKLVGAITWDNQQKLASFQYAPSFIKRGIELAPFTMPLSKGTQVHAFPELRAGKTEEVATFNGLPGLIADSLPDRYGHQLINIWLAKQGRPANSMNPVEQLCFIGNRGMGALEFRPSKMKSGSSSQALELSSLVDVAHKMLNQREGFEVSLAGNEEEAMKEILKIGTSAGGARPKAVIAFNRETKEVRSGQTTSDPGFEHWLLKLDGVSGVQFGSSHGYGRVEYAYYLMALDAGIHMMPSELLEESGRAHFMTKRYDRTDDGQKHHVQTFCGIKHADYNQLQAYSYEQLFQCMRGLKLTYPEAEQMFRRMVFNVLATNYDDHTKNFSFILKEGGKWELSPAYDVCFAYNANNVWVNQQTLSVNGKRLDIQLSDFLAVADVNNIKNAKQIVKEIHEIVCNWPNYAEQSGLDPKHTKHIAEALNAPGFEV